MYIINQMSNLKKKKKLTSIIYIILILCSLAYSLSHFLNLKKFCLDYQTLGISNAQAKNTRLIQRGTSWIAHISSMAKKPHRYVSLHEQGTRHQTCDTLSFASFWFLYLLFFFLLDIIADLRIIGIYSDNASHQILCLGDTGQPKSPSLTSSIGDPSVYRSKRITFKT